jgi:hypothetical protein
MYCVAKGDTLSSVMEVLVGDSNWLRLWAANGNEDGLDETVTIHHPVSRQTPVTQSLVHSTVTATMIMVAIYLPVLRQASAAVWGRLTFSSESNV